MSNHRFFFHSLNSRTVPRSPFGEERLFGDMNAGMAGGIAALVLIVAVTVLFICLWLAKRRRERRDPADRGAVALGKHPNVVRANLSNILSNTLYLHPIHTLAPLRHVSPLGGHLCYTIIAIFCSILAIGIQVQLLSA